MKAIFDLDGTLANADHRVHHLTGEIKDWRARSMPPAIWTSQSLPFSPLSTP